MRRRRVTFSRNLTLSLSRTCRCYCKYCAFATHQPHLHEPDEVLEILDRGVSRHRAKELLVLTGERPEHNAGVAAKLAELGFEDFTAYVVWVCEQALERGLLPHTNLGVLDRVDLERLRAVTASQGLMLESVAERLMETVHAGSPTKHPAMRLQTIEAAGELRIPFTSGILVGIGETEEDGSRRWPRWLSCTSATGTSRRSSSRTSFRTRATTARSRPTSQRAPPRSIGAPACQTDRRWTPRSGPRRSASRT